MFWEMFGAGGKKFYEEQLDYTKLLSTVEQTLEQYNTINGDKPMDLVMF